MANKYLFDYDYKNDSLYIVKPNSKIKQSVYIDDLILDVDENGNVVGLELLSASKVFGIPKKYLRHIKNVKFSISYNRSNKILFVSLLILIKTQNQEKQIKHIDEIQLEKPILA